MNTFTQPKSSPQRPEKPLPIGIQSFEKLIRGGYAYVDKTQALYELARLSVPLFLSRPRRFGKSLTIATFDALFSGKRDLFDGLWIDQSDWDWETRYPVIRLDMSGVMSRSPEELEGDIKRLLVGIATAYDVTLDKDDSPVALFGDLIAQLSARNPVVVLIDEYDKPLLDQLDNPAVCEANRALLRSFYGVLKAQDEHLRFVFITGITKFAKVSIFSGLNNLKDISMQAFAAALLGYTRSELEAVFGPRIHALATAKGRTLPALYDEIKYWYNGYRFSRGAVQVYNPFSVLLLLSAGEFEAHWFETGTPSFLLEVMKRDQCDIEGLEGCQVDTASFNQLDLSRLESIPLLYQSGYLTIKGYDEEFACYTLGYPNHEVEHALNKVLLADYIGMKPTLSNRLLIELTRALKRLEADHFCKVLTQFYAHIPYDLHIAQEKYYHTIFYLLFTLIGLRLEAEVKTNRGRMDATIELNDRLYIIECKLDQSAPIAIEQIKTHGYTEKFQHLGKPIHLIGINFDTKTRNIDGCVFEQHAS